MSVQVGATLDYNFKRRDQPNAADFNARWDDINRRMNQLEAFMPSWEALVATFTDDALARLDTALTPAYARLAAIAQLGAIFTITSTTPVAIGAGTKQFSVDPNFRQQFAAAAYLVVHSQSDPTIGMSGTLVGYERTAGTLTILVDSYGGTAGETHSDWLISAGAGYDLFRAYADLKVSALRNDLIGGADDFMNSFREVEDRFTALIGTANAAGDTLGELQATAAFNAQKASDAAVAMAIALG